MSKTTDSMNSGPVTFETFVLSLGTATLMALGEIENPISKKREKDLPSARQHIDILEVLLEKTKGNLSEHENGLINEILYTARMKFLDLNASKAKS